MGFFCLFCRNGFHHATVTLCIQSWGCKSVSLGIIPFSFQLYSSLCFYVWDIFIYDNLIEVPSFKFIYIRLTYRSVSSCLLTVSTEMVVRELRWNMSYVLIISQKSF